MTHYPPGLSPEAQRSFARTEELLSKSISIWDDFEHFLETSSHNIDQWIEIAKKLESDADASIFSSHLKTIKEHMALSKKRKPFERARYAHFNKIPPSRLIKRV